MCMVGLLLASCMGAEYAEPNPTDDSPYGNNAIEETNLVTIAQLKAEYATVIKGNGMKQITEAKQIKGFVTGNDLTGNIYNEISLQDETGAIIICIAQGGLYGYLPVGQEVLIELKDLWIGAYGQQAEIGVPYTSASGSTYVSRMSRMLWNEHYKLVGKAKADNVQPEIFDKGQLGNASYMEANCGKLMTIKGVKIKAADGTAVFAPKDGSVPLTANCANRDFEGLQASQIVLRTSTYADFANDVMPEGTVDITGIFTRYNNTWQIPLRSVDDIQPAQTAIFSETFAESLGDFEIVNLKELQGISYVWAWDARFGAKASAFVSGQAYETDSWLISPSIDLSKVSNATLAFDHVWRYGAGPGEDLKVYVSTNYNGGGNVSESNFEEVTLDKWASGDDWNFITSTVNIQKWCGSNNFRIAFRYVSSSNGAATWEIKNVLVE